MNPQTEQLNRLESRVHDLINKIGELHSQNQRLRDELSLSRQDFDKQTRELETQRLRAEEAVAAVQAAIALPDNGNSELTERVEYQSQQIELIERERTALRDQVAFLQSTLQNKERDWTAKIEHVRQESEQRSAELAAAEAEMRAEKEAQDALYHSAVSEHERQVKQHKFEQERLSTELSDLQERFDQQEGSLEKQTAMALDLQQKLDEALEKQKETETDYQARLADQKADYETRLGEQKTDYETRLDEERDQAKTKLVQEQERFRMEHALAVEKHEHSLNELNQAMNLQKERLMKDVQNLQDKNEALDKQNEEYRRLLTESAADIRKLLKRLPLPEQDPIADLGEAA